MSLLFRTILIMFGFCSTWCFVARDRRFSTDTLAQLQSSFQRKMSIGIVSSAALNSGEATSIETKYEPHGSEFCICSNCKSAFLLSRSKLGRRGRIVKCTICNKEWFQNPDRLMHTDEMNFLTDLTSTKLDAVKKMLDNNMPPKFSRTDRFEVFVGNIPYSFEEKQILDLFAEYGISSVSIARDPVGNNKGFCFLEFVDKEDADKAVNEMNGFYVDQGKKLTVRSALGYVKGSKKEK